MDDGYRSRMEPVKKSRIFLAAFCANLSSFAVGTSIGWTSSVIPKLKNKKEGSPLSITIDNEQEAWISSLLALGALAAPYVAGPLADWIGRKWTIFSGGLFFAAAYIMLLVAHNVGTIYAARVIKGFGIGFVMTAQPMYIGEISTDDIRGATGSFMQLFMACGILYVYAIGPYVSYIVLQWCCLAIPIIFCVTFFFIPESPYYYAGKARKIEAIKSLEFLRGQSQDGVQDEMAMIQANVEESMANKGTFLDIIKIAGTRKALFICVGLIFFQELSGIDAVLFNSQTIFDNAKISLDPAIATIVVGCVQVVPNGLTTLIVDRLGRKIILLVSAAGMCIALFALGTFFYVQSTGDPSGITWLPVPALIIFISMFYIGFGPITWALMSEMFPPNIKSVASSIGTSVSWFLTFMVTRWYPALDELGSFYAFWLFGIFSAIAFFYVLFNVMETKGLSLQQIQDKLNAR